MSEASKNRLRPKAIGGTSYRYRAYGLVVESALPLPELGVDQASPDQADLRIGFGRIGCRPDPDESGCGIWVRDDQACYCNFDVGAFLVSSGTEILVEPEAGVAPEALRLSLLGPALALALHQRGLFLLHASAVSVNGEAVAFLGMHGFGKSTTAALLNARGHPLVSDDLLAVSVEDQTVHPGFPQLKLWPDALQTLGLPPHELPQVHPDVPKRALRLSEGFAAQPIRLRRLYVLGIGSPTLVQTLRPAQIFAEISRHWYGVRFGQAYFDSLDVRRHFLQSAHLARDVPMRRLQRPATLADDPDLPRAMEAAILKDIEDSSCSGLPSG